MNRTSGTKTFTFFSLTKGREKKGDDFSRRGASLPFLFFLSSLRLIDHKKRPFPVLDRDLDVISRERERDEKEEFSGGSPV